MMILVYLLAALLTFGGGGLMGYQHGKKIERAHWLEKEVEQRDALSKELDLAMERKAKQENKNTENLMRVINEKDDALNKLSNDLATTRGLYIRTKNTACGAHAVSGKDESTGESSGGASRERLPESVEAGLWRLVADAQKVVIQYEACRKALMPMVETIEKIEKVNN